MTSCQKLTERGILSGMKLEAKSAAAATPASFSRTDIEEDDLQPVVN